MTRFSSSCRGVVACSTGRNHNDGYLASCSRCAEVFSPSGQFLVDVKSVESQRSLVVLHLAEVENLAHELYEYARVALNHLHHRAVLSSHRRVFKQLVGRSGDECERCAQFVAYVGEELQLCLCHSFHLLGHGLLLAHRVVQTAVDACFCHVCTYCEGAHHDEQHNEHYEHEQIYSLGVEFAGSVVYA